MSKMYCQYSPMMHRSRYPGTPRAGIEITARKSAREETGKKTCPVEVPEKDQHCSHMQDLEMLQRYYPWGKPAAGAPRVSSITWIVSLEVQFISDIISLHSRWTPREESRPQGRSLTLCSPTPPAVRDTTRLAGQGQAHPRGLTQDMWSPLSVGIPRLASRNS